MKKLKGMLKKNKGFTLIELMIVITVIAILAAMVLFGLGQAQARARDTQRMQLLRAVQTHLQAYASDQNGQYPGTQAITALYAAPLLPYSAAVVANQLQDPGNGSAATPPRDIRSQAPWAPVVYSYTSGPCTAAQTALGCRCQNLSGFVLQVVKEAGGSAFVCSPQ